MVDLGLKCGYQSEEKTVGSNIDWHIKYLTAHLKRYLRTPENMASLKCLIKTDIMGSIDKNIELGNITLEDGAQLYGNSERGWINIPISEKRPISMNSENYI